MKNVMNGLIFSYEAPPIDVITIEGCRYSGHLFRSFGGLDVGAILQIIKREDGVIHVKRLHELEEKNMEGKRE